MRERIGGSIAQRMWKGPRSRLGLRSKALTDTT